MPFIKASSFIGKNGFMFDAVSGTEAPEDWETVDLVAAAQGDSSVTTFGLWNFIGATSLENLPEAGNDGGDTDVKGSWDGLLSRQVQTEQSIDYLTINPYQFDSHIMSGYWGVGTYDPTTKRFVITDVGGTPLERAFLLIVADGPVRIGMHAWNSSFTRDDSFELSTEDYTEWPTRVTWLNWPGKGKLELLGVEDGTPAGEAAGNGGTGGGTEEPAA